MAYKIMRWMVIFACLCSGYVAAREPHVSDAALDGIVLKAWLLDAEQLRHLYQPDAPPIEQKFKNALYNSKRFFLVVEAQNRGPTPVRGRISVTYQGKVDYGAIEVVRLDPLMIKPDFFIWRKGRMYPSEKPILPNITVKWVELHPIVESKKGR